MNDDKELLTLAAKAAGIVGIDGVYPIARDSSGECYFWNPLTDDGDALRLAVKLRLNVRFWSNDDVVVGDGDDIYECMSGDPYAATRSAIVRAAAEIGRGM